jgi:phosphoribosylanthranilate isomerase
MTSPANKNLHTRIKFCGMTELNDVRVAADLGVDALGFVMVPGSKRALSVEQAARIVASVPVFISTVGLFRDPTAATVNAVIARVPFSLLQFHGSEDPVFCASFGLPFIKAVAMADRPSLLECANTFTQAKALLLDSHSSTTLGGSGHRFDWSDVSTDTSGHLPLILAGGLSADNVAAGMRAIRPWAVDVSSGIEAAPGQKDVHKMRAFVEAVRRFDQSVVRIDKNV